MANDSIIKGSSQTSKKYREPYSDPLKESKNYSGNNLDIKEPWEHFKGKSVRYCLEHRNDDIGHLGYDYRNRILKRSLSGMLFLEQKRKAILENIELTVTYLVEYIKTIKKSFNYVFEKDYRDFN